MRSPEHDLQRAYFDWARLHPVARRAFAIPNGGHRSKATAGRLKAEGVRPGVLDIMLPVPVGAAHGLWIEMKAGYNTLSPDQAQEVDALVADGYTVAVAWDALMAIAFTQEYLRGDAPPGLTLLKPARKQANAPASR